MPSARTSPWISRASFRTVLAITATICAAPLSRMARAEDGSSKVAAKARLEKGADLLVSHAYTGALTEFEDAYRLFPSPKIFFDIGLANVGLNRNPDALRAFQRFLVETPDASPETTARAKAQIQALLPLVAIVDIVCRTAGLEILVDNRSVGRSPLGAPVYLAPGSHGLVARASEGASPITTTFTVTGGARITVSVPIAASAATSPPAPLPVIATAPPSAPTTLVDTRGASEPAASERPLYRRPWFWAAGGGVVAAVTVTLLLTAGHSTSDPTPSLGHMNLPGAP
ncbi:MAG TPA: hypothetical protein VGP07_10505 [Polyangia bacterium]|jgi:hypothetical protein